MKFDKELLITSDVHLGSALTDPVYVIKFLRLFIKNDRDVEKIVILGDFLELMLNDFETIMKDKQIKLIFELLGEIHEMGIELYYILGNHDVQFISDFSDVKESFQNTLNHYNYNIFNCISQYAGFSSSSGLIPFDNFENISLKLPELKDKPQYLFLHGHQFDHPLIKPFEKHIWADSIKDERNWMKRLKNYLKEYLFDCYLRNQGDLSATKREFMELYSEIEPQLSFFDQWELWFYLQYLKKWIKKQKKKEYSTELNRYKSKIFYRARAFLNINNISNYFSHIIFGHTHIPGFYRPLLQNDNISNHLVLANTGTWQKEAYYPYIILLSANSDINLYPVNI